jgi:hypothetical protein
MYVAQSSYIGVCWWELRKNDKILSKDSQGPDQIEQSAFQIQV